MSYVPEISYWVERVHFALRCWLGRPVTYRRPAQPEADWWYAICVHCGRQAEMHRR